MNEYYEIYIRNEVLINMLLALLIGILIYKS